VVEVDDGEAECQRDPESVSELGRIVMSVIAMTCMSRVIRMRTVLNLGPERSMAVMRLTASTVI
jgi:hypothetical protein